MAQLRDAQTGELLAEGSPTDLVLIADEVGHERVMWDDVGWDPVAERARIDVDAVRDQLAEQLDALPTEDAAAEAQRRHEVAALARDVEAVLTSAQDPAGATLPPVDVT